MWGTEGGVRRMRTPVLGMITHAGQRRPALLTGAVPQRTAVHGAARHLQVLQLLLEEK